MLCLSCLYAFPPLPDSSAPLDPHPTTPPLSPPALAPASWAPPPIRYVHPPHPPSPSKIALLEAK